MQTTIEKNAGRVLVKFERRMAHPVEKVWRALTERDQLNEWFPSDIGVDAIAPDSALHFTFRKDEGPDGEGKVLEFDPPRLLVLTWYDAVLRFELTPTDDGGCVLVMSHDVEDDGVRPARDSGGWEFCISKLDELLGGPAVADRTEAEWKQVNDHFADLLR